jgi:hypothetical protein
VYRRPQIYDGLVESRVWDGVQRHANAGKRVKKRRSSADQSSGSSRRRQVQQQPRHFTKDDRIQYSFNSLARGVFRKQGPHQGRLHPAPSQGCLPS